MTKLIYVDGVKNIEFFNLDIGIELVDEESFLKCLSLNFDEAHIYDLPDRQIAFNGLSFFYWKK